MLQYQYEQEKRAIENGYCCDKGCKGRWILSDFDTWHSCNHGDPGPHPHELEAWYEAEEYEKNVAPWRERFKRAGTQLMRLGFTSKQVGEFARSLDTDQQRRLLENYRQTYPEIFDEPLPVYMTWTPIIQTIYIEEMARDETHRLSWTLDDFWAH